ncbi:cysteinyl-tRNA synthetase [Celeribacter baekdonensis]|uniref:Cysteine--tRNA ligase n=1 Tax=Celeribacter baekdonensis TaxID=875171 RepID=A0A1G7FH30_9RHOB|nr:cysteine--tRNA ligase [Celeribacter baekdonensis]SDE75229.1 cysteinyl-tRNA synthetase [Celeribacter baekdonensis]
MTVIKLTNTKTRKKEVFEPIDRNNVRMYVCGPTVYDRAHIGNARPVIVFDVLYRLLRHVYGPDHVTYVRNFTDVDDKINARAAESGRSIREITDETTQWYLDDMRAVGALDPNEMPRATEYIGAMIEMIEGLIDKGHAYAAEGHVLFAVESYEKYGALSGRSIDDMIAGARVEVAPYKRNPMDFVLWKPSSEDQPGWDSPWGYGRPGWHIECSAMSYELLGESFDIHGGGNDLMFPHHENEIAQSCCAHGHEHDGGGFANFWLHNEMLQVEGKKMSKSLGNFFTVRDLLDGHDGMAGVPGEVIRFVFLSTHYRKPMDWTAEKAEQAKATLTKWWDLTAPLDTHEFAPSEKFLAALCDDLNTPAAIAELHRLAKEKDLVALQSGLELIGLAEPITFGQGSLGVGVSIETLGLANRIAAKWMAYRTAKDFSQADALKKEASNLGVELTVTKENNVQSATATINGAPSVQDLEGLL